MVNMNNFSSNIFSSAHQVLRKYEQMMSSQASSAEAWD
jgi:hypothetical protein